METEQTTKPKFLKRVFNFLKPVVRGAVKTLPLGGAVIELVDNITKEFKGDKKKHSYASILIQLTGLGLIVYAFVTKQVTIEDVLQLLNSLFGSDAPSEATSN